MIASMGKYFGGQKFVSLYRRYFSVAMILTFIGIYVYLIKKGRNKYINKKVKNLDLGILDFQYVDHFVIKKNNIGVYRFLLKSKE